MRQLDDIFNGRVHTRYSTIEALEEEVFSADVVVGAVLIPGAAAPKLVTRDMLSGMKKGAVIVDVAIDQGGCFETSRAATTHSEPTYEVEGIVHYCVANMPGAVPITSAHALNNATLHYGLQLADRGINAIAEDRHLRAGLNVHKGRDHQQGGRRSTRLRSRRARGGAEGRLIDRRDLPHGFPSPSAGEQAVAKAKAPDGDKAPSRAAGNAKALSRVLQPMAAEMAATPRS